MLKYNQEGVLMRPIWSGTISFVLINIPVRLYSATSDESIGFDLLHKTDHSPIRYARICKKEEKEIPYEDLVKGYEFEKGNYVIIEDEDFKNADPRKTDTISIVDFVLEKEIDPIYFEKPYYLEPDEGAGKSYQLLREALKKSDKIAIGKFVLKEREHLVALKPEKDIIILNILRYAWQIKKPEGLNLPKESIEEKELKLALNLIEKLTGKFEPEKYKEEYHDILMKLIAQKAKGQKIAAPKYEAPKPTDIEELMRKLEESLKVKT